MSTQAKEETRKPNRKEIRDYQRSLNKRNDGTKRGTTDRKNVVNSRVKNVN